LFGFTQQPPRRLPPEGVFHVKPRFDLGHALCCPACNPIIRWRRDRRNRLVRENADAVFFARLARQARYDRMAKILGPKAPPWQVALVLDTIDRRLAR
jgi:hypothetical protein